MFTGIAVLGVLAGSLASLFDLEQSAEDQDSKATTPAQPGGAQPVHAELAALQAQLQAIQARLGELAQRTRAGPGDTG
jgi:hypothetical protein